MSIRSEQISLPAPTLQRGKGLLAFFSALNSAWRQRQTLSGLDKHMLDDIGVTPEAAKKEAERPFWDVPHHWWH